LGFPEIMLVKIPALLDERQIDAVCSVLRRGDFVDGRNTAGDRAALKKNNQELAPSADTFEALNNVVMTQLVRHPVYLQTAMPAKICAPIYARYTAGMEYGSHIDDSVMGPPGERYRSDISITVFLNPPDEYEGGELCIETPAGDHDIKLPAGHAVLYPSGSFHAVKPVTAGERLVALTWVQSLIRRPDQREILVRLDQARQALGPEDNAEALNRVDLCYANLFRMWAEV
jgi:PKHD-type hydroxylase